MLERLVVARITDDRLKVSRVEDVDTPPGFEEKLAQLQGNGRLAAKDGSVINPLLNSLGRWFIVSM